MTERGRGQFGAATSKGDQELRFARFSSDGIDKSGIVHGDSIVEVSCPWAGGLGLLADGREDELLGLEIGPPIPIATVRLLAPIELGADIHCVGLNYHEHRAEARDLVDSQSDVPIIFAKTLRAVVGPGAELLLPATTSVEFDWEAELGVVIGKLAHDVAANDVWQYVAGYCVVNDVTARDLQMRHKQWHLGKNVIGSTPIGPWVVARDALTTPPDVEISLTINGIVKQSARTSQLIYDIPTLIVLLSKIMTLQPGDIIATGTPSGVGYKRVPPEYLSEGDVVETVIDQVGTLVNVVRTTTELDVEAVTATTAVS
jgi:acylpyruvate hydrolase